MQPNASRCLQMSKAAAAGYIRARPLHALFILAYQAPRRARCCPKSRLRRDVVEWLCASSQTGSRACPAHLPCCTGGALPLPSSCHCRTGVVHELASAALQCTSLLPAVCLGKSETSALLGGSMPSRPASSVRLTARLEMVPICSGTGAPSAGISTHAHLAWPVRGPKAAAPGTAHYMLQHEGRATAARSCAIYDAPGT